MHSANALIAELSDRIANQSDREDAYGDIMDMLKSPVLEETVAAAEKVRDNELLPDAVRKLAEAHLECWRIGLEHKRGDDAMPDHDLAGKDSEISP